MIYTFLIGIFVGTLLGVLLVCLLLAGRGRRCEFPDAVDLEGD